MTGKAALVFVAGFSFIIGYISMNLNNLATQATSNMALYNQTTASHGIATTAANVGLAKFYQDTSWRGSISQTMTGVNKGSFTATMADLGGNKLRLQSVSTYAVPGAGNIHDTVEVYFDSRKRNSFSMYAWMTDFEGNVFWVTGDTVWGRVHSNGNLHVNGKPVFMEKATTSKGFDPKAGTGTNKAIFKKGYETGIAQIVFPTDLNEIITASAVASGGKRYAGEIWVTLDPKTSANNDGTAYVRSTKTGPIIDSIDLNNAGFDGVLLGDQKVHVQGTLDGNLSVASLTDVYVEDDVLYERNPQLVTSDDMLGLVANNNVVVAHNVANNNNVEIQASIFTRTGSFTAENYNTRGLCGTLRVLGSIVQKTRGAVGTFSGSNLTSGLSKRYRFDDRLSDPTVRPPYYPGFYVRTYAITNWWESYRIRLSL